MLSCNLGLIGIRGWYVIDTISNAAGAYFYTDGHRTEGNIWQWATSKETITSFNWVSGQPNNAFGIQDCIVLNANSREWSDWYCEMKLRAICQYP